ncbi:hypothetical protein CN568_11935 [Bacillus pseudomycoides]|uniref:hypothetical protein n=1 Tax=Bacillus pseudomycoides TaxID=64104 RepID=UPI000BF1FA0C|nr:hypothetical protein [Bacillus pseudomycoides]PEK70318.1 hypothetical protein CN593_06090 [Bacillus pseudomycoides]PEP37888.1 hypothetical protein CN565_26295 [Bacillus pseudomycoides]PEP44972.1 hypothetical protein CN568_11935 [Bacillus pseudomycoides]PFX54362.1 hypothetical protein COL31_11550 [Bacillus pseudomycoides]PFY53067.1 hypothetical protein COL49_28250 [Bacillus pseudomycoides]
MILMLCSGMLLTGMVACSNKGDENSVKSVAQNTSTEKKESPVEETKLSIEDTLSKEDQEIVNVLFNSVPEIKSYYQKDKQEYTVSLTAEVTKPNLNSTDNKEKEYYKVHFEGKVLGGWEFYVKPDNKEVLFKGIFVGNKGFYTLEEFKKEANEIDDHYKKLKEKVPEFRKNVKTTVAKKLQNKVAKKQEISDEEILAYLDEVAEPEFTVWNQAIGQKGLDIKKDRKVIKPDPSAKDPLKKDFYQVNILKETFLIKPTFEEKDIYLALDQPIEKSGEEVNSVQVSRFITFSMDMISQDAANKK